MRESEVRDEIAVLANEAIGRFGVAGAVTLEADRAVLSGPGGAVALPLGSLVEQWRELPFDERRRRVNELARGLVAARRGSLAPAPGGGGSASGGLRLLGALGLATAVAAVAWYLRSARDADEARSAPAVDAVAQLAEIERERSERAARVCEATRARFLRGGTPTPLDVEGWVVELSGLGAPGVASATALAELVGGSGRVAWAGAPDLAAVDGPDTAVTVADSSVTGADAGATGGVTLRFSGAYVKAYFDEATRPAFFPFAAAAVERLRLASAALYARCAHGGGYSTGAWFAGEDLGAVATSVVFVMGTNADVPQLRDAFAVKDGGLDRAGLLQEIRARAARLERRQVLAALSPNGGMLQGRSDGAHTITFPFRDAHRATRASRALAVVAGLAVEY
ncbi:MAG: hypothetical protein IT376_18760 [Polyangiaceae bacterium]|nr:hypothetical protein [Polyangiaceae bacterium]